MLPRSEYRPRPADHIKRDPTPNPAMDCGVFPFDRFCIFHSAPSDGDGIRQAPLTAVRWALFFTDKAQDKPAAGPVRCRSPPL